MVSSHDIQTIMSNRMKKYRNELCFLGTCSKSQRTNFINRAPAGLIHAISDAVNTVLRGRLPIKELHRKKLRREVSSLKKLSAKRGSVISKRKLLTSQRGGSILGTLWSVIKNLF